MRTVVGAEDGRAALVIARPGHELRVHGWLEQTRPAVFVLTDGSGRTGRPRLDSTARVLKAAGAQPGEIFGRFSDAALYAALLEGQKELLVRLADELGDAFLRAGVVRVAGDAAEGHDPAQDLCRALTATAAALARWRGSRPVTEHEFSVQGWPDACPRPLRRWALWVRLDDAALQRKLQAAAGYTELATEVRAALDTWGEEAFRTECLRPAVSWTAAVAGPPEYERRGEQRVASGHWAKVIRGYAHVLPAVAALRRHAEAAARPLALAS
jgi:hypothetical protein